MPLSIITDANELVRQLNAYAFADPAVPDTIRDRLQLLPGSQADKICDGAELLYAHRDLLGESGLTVMAQLFAYGSLQHWAAFNADGRCDKIVAGVRRDLGEAGDWPDAADDPEPITSWREGGFDWKAPPPPPPPPSEPE